MIYGIGTDIVDLKRIARVYERHDAAFVQRVLSPSEQEKLSGCRDVVRLLAKRFAAKEAFSKAVGTGLRAPVLLSNISVTHDDLGRPTFAYTPELAQWLQQRGIAHVHLSISDETHTIVAFAVAERAA